MLYTRSDDPGIVRRFLVQVGSRVRLDQPLVELEMLKSTLELPSPEEGVVTDLLAIVGQSVGHGDPLLTLESVPET
ncbi:biotin/lipoyl-containing protein [Gemmata algarum]|uniref:biotin/lipoyl-containing protein n=1 Tax=Gemmata algarum TaxID=2975278 RepID=UPI0038B3BB3E